MNCNRDLVSFDHGSNPESSARLQSQKSDFRLRFTCRPAVQWVMLTTNLLNDTGCWLTCTCDRPNQQTHGGCNPLQQQELFHEPRNLFRDFRFFSAFQAEETGSKFRSWAVVLAPSVSAYTFPFQHSFKHQRCNSTMLRTTQWRSLCANKALAFWVAALNIYCSSSAVQIKIDFLVPDLRSWHAWKNKPRFAFVTLWTFHPVTFSLVAFTVQLKNHIKHIEELHCRPTSCHPHCPILAADWLVGVHLMLTCQLKSSPLSSSWKTT